MSKKRVELPELTPAQAEIMEIIWHRGEASASEVRTILVRTGGQEHGVQTAGADGREGLDHASRGRPDVSLPCGLSEADDRRPEGAGNGRDGLRRLGRGSGHGALHYRGLSSGELDRVRSMLAQARATKKERGRHDFDLARIVPG